QKTFQAHRTIPSRQVQFQDSARSTPWLAEHSVSPLVLLGSCSSLRTSLLILVAFGQRPVKRFLVIPC
ncbi:hypothetical protein LEMLEM_LOCUS10069, partial [Lemmus lemmus]